MTVAKLEFTELKEENDTLKTGNASLDLTNKNLEKKLREQMEKYEEIKKQNKEWGRKIKPFEKKQFVDAAEKEEKMRKMHWTLLRR